MPSATLRKLFGKYLSGDISLEELRQLGAYIQDDACREVLDELLAAAFVNKKLAENGMYEPVSVFEEMMARIKKDIPVEETPPLPRSTYRLKISTGTYAAAAGFLLLIMITTIFFYFPILPSRKRVVPPYDGHHTYVQEKLKQKPEETLLSGRTDIRAMLILGDGRKLPLENTGNGVIVHEDGMIITSRDGEIRYTPDGTGRKTLYHTLITRHAGQFKMVLPDGSLVKLNAMSSLRYPLSFDDHKRAVTLTGEAYFEVQHNADKPFTVEIGEETVKVLGTRFNIMGYENEKSIKTTVLEGAVKVSSGMLRGKTTAIVTPGEQAILDRQYEQLIVEKVPVEDALAWTRGLFRFRNMKLEEVMRQVARWYDVEIVYKQDMSDVILSGLIAKEQHLSRLLATLEMTGEVHFSIQGNNILVSQ